MLGLTTTAAVFDLAVGIARAATYTPPGGGAAVACAVVWDRGDVPETVGGGVGGLAARGAFRLRVRASEVTPAAGGSFLVAGVTYRVHGTPMLPDIDRLVWLVPVVQTA